MIVVYSDSVISKHICLIYFQDWAQFLEAEERIGELQRPLIIDLTKKLKNLSHWDQCKELWRLVAGNDVEESRIQICSDFVNILKDNINSATGVVSNHEIESRMNLLNERRS